MKTIFCFNNGGVEGEWYGVAIAEDGKALVLRIVEDPKYMQHDLGLTSDRSHAAYDQHCGVGGWVLKWVDNALDHPALQVAIALNREMAEAAAKEPCECAVCVLKDKFDRAAATVH
jgi:hypothetical protein